MARIWAAMLPIASAASPTSPSERAQHGARRRAVRADHTQRQADQLVPARGDAAKIEAPGRGHACIGQDPGRHLVADREVVDADQPDAELDQQTRTAAVEPNEVAGELVEL